MQLVDGRRIANQILEDLAIEVKRLPFQPLVCDVLVGDDPVSRSYVRTKARAAEKIGLMFEMVEFAKDIETSELVTKLKQIQENPQLAGLIIQLPIPAHLERSEILNSIGWTVDVDCLSEANSKLFYSGRSKFLPPTAAAILTILKSLGADLPNKEILVIGQGELVGRPVSFLLRQEGDDVHVADSATENLKQASLSADIIISATGQPNLVVGDMVKPGAIVIDCGTAESNGGIAGDVDMESVSTVASFISPVPGGVGPVTVARLLYNVVQAAKAKNK